MPARLLRLGSPRRDSALSGPVEHVVGGAIPRRTPSNSRTSGGPVGDSETEKLSPLVAGRHVMVPCVRSRRTPRTEAVSLQRMALSGGIEARELARRPRQRVSKKEEKRIIGERGSPPAAPQPRSPPSRPRSWAQGGRDDGSTNPRTGSRRRAASMLRCDPSSRFRGPGPSRHPVRTPHRRPPTNTRFPAAAERSSLELLLGCPVANFQTSSPVFQSGR